MMCEQRRSCNLASRRRGEGIVGCVGTLFAPNYEEDDILSEMLSDETHSAWTLESVGASGKVCTVNWRILRKWNGSRVVLEHHYDHQQSGEPLTDGNLRFGESEMP
jgi:hypothetical protein